MSVRKLAPLNVVLCWHMHQPEYRDPLSGEYIQPWTYLHAIKDYTDMAAHLEANPKARAVVNFVPLLLEQIDDYGQSLRAHLDQGAPLKDPLLAALSEIPPSASGRAELIRKCLRANGERIIAPHPPYAQMAALGRLALDNRGVITYLDENYYFDLVVWYHLAWMGETVRRADPRLAVLETQGHAYSASQRRLLLSIIAGQIQGLIPRYRALAESGRVELSMSPYSHPMLPLLLDFQVTREAVPEAPLPHGQYPGGEERVCWHLARGRKVFEHYFGQSPKGCWPSEGGVSSATLRAIADSGFSWVASGGNVLKTSLHSLQAEPYEACLHSAWKLDKVPLHCFFRDDGLSDLIGFQYKDWHADDAVANLVGHLEQIAALCPDPHNVAAIILDGENAWEHYPSNGYHFLHALYERLSSHPRLNLTTFGALVKKYPRTDILPQLVAGSWVYGTFSTWMGDKDKNRAWDMLVAAKQAADQALPQLDPVNRDAVLHQLAICEGSDWFWWLGEYNAADTVADFERLYRLQLARLYRMIGQPEPEYLDTVFARGGGDPALGGAMRPGNQ
ncbi:MAG TPA: glycoside hydrolase family 57 protein [Thiobacillaceae bacterium]|nr:glycoside hydrolase family 57 protein [Thiobacillaceae bacterium]